MLFAKFDKNKENVKYSHLCEHYFNGHQRQFLSKGSNKNWINKQPESFHLNFSPRFSRFKNFNWNLFLSFSSLSIIHSHLSPGPRLVHPLSLLLWIKPAWPTPIFTNTPKEVTLVTMPETTCPFAKSSIDCNSFLKDGCCNST